MERAVIIAIGVLACIVYLAAGRLDIGTSAFDVTLSPAMTSEQQLAISSRDVPSADRLSISGAIGRASIWVARGRRTALRDLAAVTSAAVITVFGMCLSAVGVPVFPIALTMLAMMMGQSFWWRGVYWSADALTPAIGRTVDVSAEFTTLGLCLATIGAIVMSARSTKTIVVLIVAAALCALHLTDVPLVIYGWAAIAIAMDWLLRVMPARSGHVLVTVVAIVLIGAPALSRIRLSALGRDLDSSLEARAAYDLRPDDLPVNAAFIAESRRVDSMVRLSRMPIVAQSPDDLDAALRDGRVSIAFPGAQRHLEQLGFLFERAFAGNIPVGILTGHTPCIDLVDGEWRDVSSLTATGSFILHGATFGSAPGGAVVKVANATTPRVTAIEPRSTPYEVADADGSISIRVPKSSREDAITVTLDAPPVSAAATADEGSPVRMCAGVLREPPMLGRASNASVQIRMNDALPFVSGWHPIEADPDYFRWTAARESIVRITMAPPGPVRVTVTATPAARPAQKPSIVLGVNACVLKTQPMQAGQADYEWIVAAECWKAGVNQLSINVSPLISPSSLFATHDTRLLGARIGAIHLTRVSNAQNAK